MIPKRCLSRVSIPLCRIPVGQKQNVSTRKHGKRPPVSDAAKPPPPSTTGSGGCRLV